MKAMRILPLTLVLAAFILGHSPDAEARSRVRWHQIKVRPGEDAKRVKRSLTRLLKRATRRAKWGKGSKRIELSAKVTQLAWQRHDDDILRLSVAIVARVRGGRRARSFIRVGGSVKQRRKLENQALKIVAGGLVTRLAEMVRKSRS
jgi:hypothetical protein